MSPISAKYNDIEEIKEILQKRQTLIQALLSITEKISINPSKEYIFSAYYETLKKYFEVTDVIILYKTGDSWFVLDNGNSSYLNDLSVIQQMEEFTKAVYLNEDERVLGQFDTIIPIYSQGQPICYIMINGIYNNLKGPIEDEIEFLEAFSQMVVTSLENKRMSQNEQTLERQEKDLTMAAEIQKALIPNEFPDMDQFDFAASYIPHFEIGGDSFDVIKHPFKNQVFISIADVSGKGVPAALLMANFQATLRSLIKYVDDYQEFAQELNQRIYNITKGDRFVSLFLAQIDMDKKVIRYINFGHNPPYLKMDNELHKLDEGTILLGVFEELPFLNLGHFDFDKDFNLFAYTDGLVDVPNVNEVPLGEDAIREFLKSDRSKNPSDQIAKLEYLIHQYAGKDTFTDDITVLSTFVQMNS